MRAPSTPTIIAVAIMPPQKPKPPPILLAKVQAMYVPSIYSEPCAILTIRVTPKISESPAATKNRPEAAERPLSAWNKNASRVIGPAIPPLKREGGCERKRAAGWGFLTPAPTRSLSATTLPRKRGRDWADKSRSLHGQWTANLHRGNSKAPDAASSPLHPTAKR